MKSVPESILLSKDLSTDSLEKEMTTHSSTLAWKIPWMEELGAGYCPWGRKESGMTERLHFHFQAWLCPPKQYPYFPIASPTYQKEHSPTH